MPVPSSGKIYVAGHRGLAGSAIVRKLAALGYDNLLTRTHAELDLTDRTAVFAFFEAEKPEYVYDAAARVGGIQVNNEFAADFIRDNMLMQMNVIEAAHLAGVKKLLFLGSACIYPRDAPQPLKEESLLTGPLEPTNEWYAIAKIAGIKLCQAYRRQYGLNAICLMPANLYGPGDNFDLRSSHVLPALIRKVHDARRDGVGSVEVWGTGKPRREFLFAEDLADACVFLMDRYESGDIINVGSGEEMSISELAHLVKEVIGYEGNIRFDTTRPDGSPRRLLDVSRIRREGWQPATDLRDGIQQTYRWFLDHQADLRR